MHLAITFSCTTYNSCAVCQVHSIRRANLVLQIAVSIMFQQQLYGVCVTVCTGKNESRPPVLWGTIS